MLIIILLFSICAADASSFADYEDKIEEIQHAVCRIATEEVQATANATITRQLKGICTSKELSRKLERLEARLGRDLQLIKNFLRIDEDNQVIKPSKRQLDYSNPKEFTYLWKIDNAEKVLESGETLLSSSFQVSGIFFSIKLMPHHLGPRYCGLELRGDARRPHRFVIINQLDSKLDISSQMLGDLSLNFYRISGDKMRRFIHRVDSRQKATYVDGIDLTETSPYDMEFFIHNLCKEILTECKTEDVECNNNFILYYLKLLALDPIWNLYPSMKEINRLDALRLIDFVVAKMKHQYCPCIITLKIQMYFECNFEEKMVIVDNEKKNFETRLKPLKEEIIQLKGTENVEDLRKKIIYYVTLWRGTGNPTKLNVYREAKQALYSVYDNNDLTRFMEKENNETKEEELEMLCRICTGIRIFNWSTDKGGEGLENLPQLVNQSVHSTIRSIQSALVGAMDKINFLTTAIDRIFRIHELEPKSDDEPIRYSTSCYVPYGVDYSEIEYNKDLIIVFRQLEVLYRKVLDAVEEVSSNANELDDTLTEALDKFNEQTFLKIGVPTEIVFPIFIELDSIWNQYQSLIIYMTKLNQILFNLELYTKDFEINVDIVRLLLEDFPVLTDLERLRWIGDPPSRTNTEISLLSTEDGKDVKVEFLGFCPWKLIETQGGLIPGNPTMGVFKYREKNYCFCCIEGFRSFEANPEQIINEALELARKKTELIPLLGLHDDLLVVQMVKELVVEQTQIVEKVVMESIEVQTELHPIERRVDTQYKWNVWDWKRQAISMANISKMQTHSSQTLNSMNKQGVSTQTYELKESETQTKRDNYTNVSTPQTYFFGLRGRKDDKQFILDLTKPNTEKP